MKNFSYSKRLNIKILFLLIFGLIFLINCSSLSRHNRRGKLSDAMEKASDENTGSRKTETEFKPDYENNIIYDDRNYTHKKEIKPPFIAFPAPDAPNNFLWISAKGGTGIQRSNDFFGLNHLSISTGGYCARQSLLQISAGIGWSPLQKTSKLNQSIKNGITLLNIGLEYKKFTTPHYTFLGQYFLFGMNYNVMYWRYKNPIKADVYDYWGNVLYTEYIRSDWLSGIELFTGIGFNIVQTHNTHLGFEITPGIILWGFHTYEGFDNDVFDPFLYVKFKLLCSFGLNI